MASPIMIKVISDNGKRFLLNLQYVEVVEFASLDPKLSNNLNVERITMEGGEVLSATPGTWNAAIAALYAEFNENPQPPQNVKGQLYVMPTV